MEKRFRRAQSASEPADLSYTRTKSREVPCSIGTTAGLQFSYWPGWVFWARIYWRNNEEHPRAGAETLRLRAPEHHHRAAGLPDVGQIIRTIPIRIRSRKTPTTTTTVRSRTGPSFFRAR